MSDAQSYFDGLVAQGYTPEQATSYTQQHYPGFAAATAPIPQPMAAVPVVQAVPAMVAAPAMVAPHTTVIAQPGVMVMQQNNTSVLVSYLLWFFLAPFGVHHLYMGRGIGVWLIALITFQGLGFWWLADLFLIPSSCAKIR